MNKKLRNLTIASLISLSTLTGVTTVKASTMPQNATLWCVRTNIARDKVWRINFNYAVDVSSLANVHVYDSQEQDLPLIIYVINDGKSIEVQPAEQYKAGGIYNLYVDGVTSGSKVLKPTWMEFIIQK